MISYPYHKVAKRPIPEGALCFLNLYNAYNIPKKIDDPVRRVHPHCGHLPSHLAPDSLNMARSELS